MGKTFLRKSIEEAARIKRDLPEVSHKTAMKMAKKFVRKEEENENKVQ